MTTITTITIVHDDATVTDWGMVQAAAERAQRWEGGEARISVYQPERDGTKHYALTIFRESGAREIAIGVLKRPGSDEIEFHS